MITAERGVDFRGTKTQEPLTGASKITIKCTPRSDINVSINGDLKIEKILKMLNGELIITVIIENVGHWVHENETAAALEYFV